MRKLGLNFALILIVTVFSYSQSSVFVLVDVSASGPSSFSPRADAKRITKELIMGTYSESHFPDWEWSGELDNVIENIRKGSFTPLIDIQKDAYMMVMPFGMKDRYKDYRIEKVSNLEEFEKFYEKFFPVRFKDQQTYVEIARAMAASIAKSEDVDISSYYLIEVWDGLPDTNSQLPGYTRTEETINDSYRNKNTVEISLGTYRYRGANSKNYKIVIKKVDINNLKIEETKPPRNNVTRKKLTLVRPQDGTQRKPVKHSGPIIWKCLGCAKSTKYTVTAKYVGNKLNVKTITKQTTGSNIVLKFPEEGTYQITVSGDGLRSKSSFIKTKETAPVSFVDAEEEGSSGFLLFILLLLVASGAYYFLRKRPSSRKSEYDDLSIGESKRPKNNFDYQDDDSDFGDRF